MIDGRMVGVLVLGSLLGWAPWAVAQPVPAPAQQAARQGAPLPAPGGAAAATSSGAPPASPPRAPDYPVHPWDLEPIVIYGTAPAALREEQLIGAYRQPRWTAQRRFPTTRVYVVPAGKMEFEWWLKYKSPLDALEDGRETESQLEFEMGLGHRLQLDLYLVSGQEGAEGPLLLTEEKVELRYALADWGRLWGNPTLYAEWAHQSDAPDKLEGKFLLGDVLAPRWHWGANLVLERELGDAHGHEYAVAAGVSYTVIDQVLSAGLEAQVELVDAAGDRLDFAEQEYLVGPSLMWSPIAPAHVLLTPLIGAAGAKDPTTGDSDFEARFETLLIVGWTF